MNNPHAGIQTEQGDQHGRSGDWSRRRRWSGACACPVQTTAPEPEARHGRQTRRLPASLQLDPREPQLDPPFFFPRSESARARPPGARVRRRSHAAARGAFLRAARARRHDTSLRTAPNAAGARHAHISTTTRARRGDQVGTTWILRARLASRLLYVRGSWRVSTWSCVRVLILHAWSLRAAVRAPRRADRRGGGPRAVNSPGSERVGGGDGYAWWIHIHHFLLLVRAQNSCVLRSLVGAPRHVKWSAIAGGRPTGPSTT